MAVAPRFVGTLPKAGCDVMPVEEFKERDATFAYYFPPSTDGSRPGIYYANSYACRPESPGEVSAWTEYDGDRFPAVMRRGKLLGVQFHPEKSSSAGVRFLQSYLSEVRA